MLYGGWILLASLLALALLGFIIAWAISMMELQNVTVPYGPFGVLPGTDGLALSKCGTSGRDPCIYTMVNLQACWNQCDLVPACQAFSYNPTSLEMKIVSPNINTFASSSVNLFVRQ